jgi:hypothetical protein
VRNLFDDAVPNKVGVEAMRLRAALHSFQAKIEVLWYKNKGLEESLTTKDKHRKKSKHLDLQQRKEFHSKAVFWLPSTICKLFARKAVKQRKAHEYNSKKVLACSLETKKTTRTAPMSSSSKSPQQKPEWPLSGPLVLQSSLYL